MSAMSVEAMPATVRRGRAGGLNRRMVSAEFLKVRKRRGLVVWSALLTTGVVTVVYAVLAILHAQNPVRYGPAGGISSLAGAANVLALLGSVAAVLIGSAVGAGDVQAGVFRDLVATGRSRVSLFAARIPGGLALLWPLIGVAWIIASASSVVFAGSHPAPGIGLMLTGGAWVLLATTSTFLLSVGLASLTGSRSTTVGILLAWQLAVAQLLLQITALGGARQAIQPAAISRLMPAGLVEGQSDPVSGSMTIVVAIVVVAAWAVIPLVAGAWRTRSRDA
jgi:hypothetical protein